MTRFSGQFCVYIFKFPEIAIRSKTKSHLLLSQITYSKLTIEVHSIQNVEALFFGTKRDICWSAGNRPNSHCYKASYSSLSLCFPCRHGERADFQRVLVRRGAVGRRGGQRPAGVTQLLSSPRHGHARHTMGPRRRRPRRRRLQPQKVRALIRVDCYRRWA